jgi:hypothetical protein
MPRLISPAPCATLSPKPMVVAQDFAQITAGLWIWQGYEPAIKSDLFSTAVGTDSGLYFIDPIPLAEDALNDLCYRQKLAGVIVTNENHFRASSSFADRFSIPMLTRSNCGSKIGCGLDVFVIEGAASGEIVLFKAADRTLIVGDVLINFEPDGFTILPRKYCGNEKQMRKSLRQLLPLKVDRICFAHGEPILSAGAKRLARLLGS